MGMDVETIDGGEEFNEGGGIYGGKRHFLLCVDLGCGWTSRTVGIDGAAKDVLGAVLCGACEFRVEGLHVISAKAPQQETWSSG